MTRVIYRKDADGGAWDFKELQPDEAERYVLPDRTGDPETDLWEAVGPLTDESLMALHDPGWSAISAVEFLKRVRASKLLDCDYMAYSDYPHTFTQAWKDYRQALRDLPANNPNVDLDEDGMLINVAWPEQPAYPGNTGPM